MGSVRPRSPAEGSSGSGRPLCAEFPHDQGSANRCLGSCRRSRLLPVLCVAWSTQRGVNCVTWIFLDDAQRPGWDGGSKRMRRRRGFQRAGRGWEFSDRRPSRRRIDYQVRLRMRLLGRPGAAPSCSLRRGSGFDQWAVRRRLRAWRKGVRCEQSRAMAGDHHHAADLAGQGAGDLARGDSGPLITSGIDGPRPATRR